MNRAYFSIAENKNKTDELLVRARIEGDIEKIFPNAIVKQWTGTDYRYRTSLPKKLVSKTIKKEIEKIDYSNFKDSVAPDDFQRHEAYYDVWFDLLELQKPQFPTKNFFQRFSSEKYY